MVRLMAEKSAFTAPPAADLARRTRALARYREPSHSECLKFTHCQRVDVADSPSVKMARVCMMNRMCAAPVVVRRQRQNTEKPAHPVVRQTIAKEGTMSAIMLDHEQTYEKAGSRHPRQKR